MISNFVTHLWSYTNTAIAGNSAPILSDTPHERRQQCQAERRCLRIEHWYRHNEWVFECFMMLHNVLRVFHDVLQVVHDGLRVVHDVLRVVHDVLRVVHDVLWVFHDVSRFTSISWIFTMFNCFTMFSKSRNDRHCQLPIAKGIATTLQGSTITARRSVITQQKSAISPRKLSHATPSSMETGETLFLEDNLEKGELVEEAGPQYFPCSCLLVKFDLYCK